MSRPSGNRPSSTLEARPDNMRGFGKKKPHYKLRKFSGFLQRYSKGLSLLAFVVVLCSACLGAYQYVFKRIRSYAGRNPTVLKSKKHILNLMDYPRITAETMLRIHRDNPHDALLPKFAIAMTEKQYQELCGNLPASGRKYHKCSLKVSNFAGIGEFTSEAGVRFRGDGAAHWAYPKKSWRIKLPKDHLLDGMQRVNLINPKSMSMLNDYMATWLAQRIGLLTPDMDMVKLYVNGHYHGVMLLVEQPDQHFLKRHGRPSGNIYGEAAQHRSQLFSSIHAWRKYSVEKGMPQDDFSDIEALLNVLNHPDDRYFEMHLEEILDVDAFLRWHAISEFTRSYHQDRWHNARLYFDPEAEKFQFLLWDLQAFYPYDDPYPLDHPLVLRMLSRPKFQHQFNNILAEITVPEHLESETMETLDRMARRIRNAVLADHHKAYALSGDARAKFSNKRHEQAVAALRDTLAGRFAELRGRYSGPATCRLLCRWAPGDKVLGTLYLYRPSDWLIQMDGLDLHFGAQDIPAILPKGLPPVELIRLRTRGDATTYETVSRGFWQTKDGILRFPLHATRLPIIHAGRKAGTPSDVFLLRPALPWAGELPHLYMVSGTARRLLGEHEQPIQFQSRIVDARRFPHPAYWVQEE